MPTLDELFNELLVLSTGSGYERAARHLIEHKIPERISHLISANRTGEITDYKCEGSFGAGVEAAVPWVAIFDRSVTTSAQRGYYIVYLIRKDRQGFCLSLNQGVMEARERYGSKTKKALQQQARDFRERLSSSGLQPRPLDLGMGQTTGLGQYYESGDVFHVDYRLGTIPNEARLMEDLESFLKLYDSLKVSLEPYVSIEDFPYRGTYVEHFVPKVHLRIERNRALAAAVKRAKGRKCQACGMNFKKMYPGISKNDYIEAHHLRLVSSLAGEKVDQDPEKDFAVLCANCHRMIHRFERPWDIEGFKQTLRPSK